MSDLVTEFTCLLVTPDQTIYEGQASRVFAPGPQGEFAILPHHTPFYSQLLPGKVKVDGPSGQQEFDIDGGIIRVRTNSVTIIVGF